jgi:hypothetical protein
MLEVGTLRGARGLVKQGYHVAAEIADFVLAIKTGDLVGRVARCDPFLLTQTPLVFVMPTKVGAATWPIELLTVADGRLTARLGPLRPKD